VKILEEAKKVWKKHDKKAEEMQKNSIIFKKYRIVKRPTN
jgi:hypothetical protein